MALKYYRKMVPNNPVQLSSGGAINFKTVDGVIGWYATDQPGIQAEFESYMRQDRYGLSEVSAEIFSAEYVEKKTASPTLNPPWREEFTGARSLSKLGQSSGESASAAAAAVVSDTANRAATPPAVAPTVAPVISPPESAPAQPATAPEFKPPVGPRKRAARTTTAKA